MPMGLNCTVGSPVAKLITRYFYIMLSQNNALVIDVSIVDTIYEFYHLMEKMSFE